MPTIQKLHKAGIITWMLTGDKKETAINMAHAVGMVDSSIDLIDLCEVLDRKSLYTLMDEVCKNQANFSPKPCLIIDGKAISAISKSLNYKFKLSAISIKCHSIVACRYVNIFTIILCHFSSKNQSEFHCSLEFRIT